MRHDPSYFNYVVDLKGRFNGKSFYWTLPRDISAKDDLFRAFSGSLWFPRHFEFDWDALYDCLCDFDWMADRTIVLVHDALPRLPEADLAVYLSVLRDAVRWWRFDDPHQLEVVFQDCDRPTIERLLGTD
jgi:hypothetical protein